MSAKTTTQRIAGLALLAGMTVTGLLAATGAANAAPRTTNPATSSVVAKAAQDAPAYAAEVLKLTNQERAKAGCGALVANTKLAAAAKGHNDEMAAQNYFSHTGADGSAPAQRVDAAGYYWRATAENIAMGQSTPAAVVRAWMNSAGHKANILNCAYKDLGVAYTVNSRGKAYWTENFGSL
ncbi:MULTISPECIES: CAP domain-containing protein [Actinosynnema]|uniref:SCP domain-containing protein n=1 Tax=Actinosynnema pretiosum TaxID=42197 RepID=A0A290Z9C5_9PSEU|nr:CAP domain-containing protein [Actinosynnema pretiosum]ATE55630.1 hypothetical protein CNX65_22000 [Actinosynnema pretiosum]